MAEVAAIIHGGLRAGLALLRDYFRNIRRARLSVGAVKPINGAPIVVLFLDDRAVGLTVHEARDLVHCIGQAADDFPQANEILNQTLIIERLVDVADRIEAGEFADG